MSFGKSTERCAPELNDQPGPEASPVYLVVTKDGLNSRMLIAPLPAQRIDKVYGGASRRCTLVTIPIWGSLYFDDFQGD